MTQRKTDSDSWPALHFDEWNETYATLHMWTQIAGKVRLALTPWLNHSWHVTQYVTARGLTSSPIPHGSETFQLDFDFIDHNLWILTSRGDRNAVELRNRTVSDFYRDLFRKLDSLGIRLKINTTPNEVAEGIPFDKDDRHQTYTPEHAHRFWKSLVQADRVFKEFRARFTGKCSPVHFFWGSFDLAVTRFSGRPAPEHPGGVPNLPDWVAREAYSHEVSSVGFWPGGKQFPLAVFYSYAYPEPAGYQEAKVAPSEAYYHKELREFVLPYESVRTAANPDAALLEFLQRTYEAAANSASWDRKNLETSDRFRG